MRPWMLIVLAMVLGLCSGLGLTVIELGASPAGSVQADLLKLSQPPKGPRPHVVVDQDEFDFGSMEHDASNSHKFTVRNDGDAPLELTKGDVSCGKCTSFSIAKAELAPGESTEVDVQWTGINGGPFRQSATVNTNDPMRASVQFTINGKVLSPYRVNPEELVFSNLSVTDSPKADLQIFSYHGKGLAVTQQELTDKETAGNFTLAIKPMPADAVTSGDADAKSGVVVQVTVKPGLPLGPIRQKIRLRLNLPEEPVVEVPIEGTVTSDLQVIGRENWDADRGLLKIGMVNGHDGAKAELFVHARGAHRHDLKPKVRNVTPDWLKVSIGQATDLAGETVRVPITVEVPPGSPAGIHLGSQQGELGEIVIDTGHPEAKVLRIKVGFAVGG